MILTIWDAPLLFEIVMQAYYKYIYIYIYIYILLNDGEAQTVES